VSRLAVKPCRACGTEIFWLRHAITGVPLPVEVHPDRTGKGNLVIDVDRETYVVVPPGVKTYEKPIHANHRLTCLNPSVSPA
jgi:hypothetical protein